MSGEPNTSTAWSRLLAGLERQGGCLVWVRGKTGGYGTLSVGNRMVRAHRLMYEHEVGPIPDGMDVDHSCHNRACCEPSHLRLATRKQNSINRSGPQPGSQTGVRGVYRHGSGFRAQFKAGGKTRNLGTYRTVEEAAEAVRKGREEYAGEFAGK